MLVIFNEEKIGEGDQEKALQTFREKAFDIEMQLETSPAEAFDIALRRYETFPYAEILRKSVIKLGVTNIRVISRILTIAEQVLAVGNDLDEELITESLPAVVVTTAIYYDAVKDAPSFTDLRGAYGAASARPSAVVRPVQDSLGQALSKPEAFRQQHMLHADRRFYDLIVEHVKTGNLLKDKFAAFWQTANEDLIRRRLRNDVESWLKDVEWSPEASASLLMRAHALVKQAHLLTSERRKEVIEAVRQLGDSELAAQFEHDTVPPAPAVPVAVTPSDSGSRVSRDSTADNEVVKLLKRLGANPFLEPGSIQALERITEAAMVRAYGTADRDEFKSFVEMLLHLQGLQIHFDANPLARAIVHVSAQPESARRAELLRSKLGQEDAKRLFALGRGERIQGWPQKPQFPQ